MNRTHALYTATAALVLAIAAPAVAAGPLQVVSKVSAETKSRAADGTTRVTWGPTHKMLPGEHMMFTLEYRNTGTQPISGIVLDNPVPKGIVYRGPAEGSPAPELSVDGQTYGTLASLRAHAAGGMLRAATPEDVTHVRWKLAAPVAPGAKGELSFQAVLK